MNIDRLTFGLARGERESNSRLERLATTTSSKWRIQDVCLLLIIMVVNYPVYYQEPFQRQFSLDDRTISHPYAEVERVNDVMLFIYSFIVPALSIFVVWLLFADPRHRYYLIYVSMLGLIFAWFSCSLFTNFIKNWIGRLRPDFLLDANQDQIYQPIGLHLLATQVKVLLAWATYITGFVVNSLQKRTSLIALSRTQDYRHHFIDVIIGSILGMVFAHFTYRRYFPSITDELPFKPLLDDSTVGTDLYSSANEEVSLPTV
ncbi:related to Diacylglycerol pyrophosphate phosphatase 1 [Nakaseomyces glabratus]|nr:related to Diacylglycerol pyrophosphate phosphatase 1 [Nakaseomyces glabratus]SLM12274.1 related to Diacylglycerol pyrophosphate phosphatase 1 [Nakaseomyces glabratus]